MHPSTLKSIVFCIVTVIWGRTDEQILELAFRLLGMHLGWRIPVARGVRAVGPRNLGQGAAQNGFESVSAAGAWAARNGLESVPAAGARAARNGVQSVPVAGARATRNGNRKE